MGKITRTTEVQDERKKGKSLEADTQGVRARLDAMPDATIDDIGTDKLKLRQGDDRNAMIAAVRADAASKYKLTVVENPETEDTEVYEEPIEAQETDPRFTALKEQYEYLSGADRTYQGKMRTWDDIVKAIPNMPDFLAGMNSLTEAQVYFLNEEGQLVLGDSCAEPFDETLGVNYRRSRSRATRISYIDSEGEVVVADGDDTEIPSEAQVLSERGLITLEEYGRKNKGQFEQHKIIWVESGKDPSLAHRAGWRRDNVRWDPRNPDDKSAYLGSRRVLRVNLNFKS